VSVAKGQSEVMNAVSLPTLTEPVEPLTLEEHAGVTLGQHGAALSLLPLFTRVRRRGVLRSSSPVTNSRNWSLHGAFIVGSTYALMSTS
jgi:hypothetical protein